MTYFADRGETHEESIAWSLPVAAAYASTFVAVALVAPLTLRAWSEEDRLVEWLQVFCLLIAGVLLTATACRHLRHHRRFLTGAFAVAAAAFFFAAGEEISWGQRILDIETPPGWAEINHQDELNLHNVAKTEIETWLKRGVAFIALVGTACLALRWRRIGGIAMPGATIVLLLALSAAFRDFSQPYKVAIPAYTAAVVVLCVLLHRRRWALAAAAVWVLAAIAAVVWLGSTRVPTFGDLTLNESRELIELFAATNYAAILFTDAAAEEATARATAPVARQPAAARLA